MSMTYSSTVILILDFQRLQLVCCYVCPDMSLGHTRTTNTEQGGGSMFTNLFKNARLFAIPSLRCYQPCQPMNSQGFIN